MNRLNKAVVPFLGIAILAFLFALWGGLMRMGWRLPAITPSLAMAHGPLMISGFLGTLITVERAVALKQRWMFIPAILAGLGSLFTLLIKNFWLGPVLLTLASLGGAAILVEITRRETALYTVTMLFGAAAWFAGSVFWLGGWQIFQIVMFWQAFLVLTILGERLELSRVLRPSAAAGRIFIGILVVYLASLLVFLSDMQWGARLNGASLLAFSLWSLRNDIAWRNLRHPLALTRYIAWCLALGFAWMGLGGLISLGLGAQAAGPGYDAALHAVFVGFVISMIFGHAPIIFPAVLGVQISFNPLFYIQLILLHVSLAVRMLGSLANLHEVRLWGGLLNEVAILVFLGMTVHSIRRSLKASV
ncbi:MAG: hypothetical protein DPW18_15800 [Chloroflexi bacterium]|nr:hypothetical protein [Chloroflexota bacterium]MDL1940807.1 hypothetical protein [Chloroflexi bacterium CFX2]